MQVADELFLLDEPVRTPLSSRLDFVRTFTAGQSINRFAPGSVADREIKSIANEIRQSLKTATPSLARRAKLGRTDYRSRRGRDNPRPDKFQQRTGHPRLGHSRDYHRRFRARFRLDG